MNDFKGSVLRKSQRLNRNSGVATVDQRACHRMPRRADARLRIRLLVGFAGEVPSHIRPKSYLRRQRSYPACCAIQSQNILTTTMASSTATAAKVVPGSLVTPFRATLEHSAKLSGSLILTKMRTCRMSSLLLAGTLMPDGSTVQPQRYRCRYADPASRSGTTSDILGSPYG